MMDAKNVTCGTEFGLYCHASTQRGRCFSFYCAIQRKDLFRMIVPL